MLCGDKEVFMEAILVCLSAFLTPEAFNFYVECIRTKMIKRIILKWIKAILIANNKTKEE